VNGRLANQDKCLEKDRSSLSRIGVNLRDDPLNTGKQMIDRRRLKCHAKGYNNLWVAPTTCCRGAAGARGLVTVSQRFLKAGA
jgi:hypothetical protein